MPTVLFNLWQQTTLCTLLKSYRLNQLVDLTTEGLVYFVFALTELIVKKHLRVVPLLEGRNPVTGSRTKDMLHRQEEFLDGKSKIVATE